MEIKQTFRNAYQAEYLGKTKLGTAYAKCDKSLQRIWKRLKSNLSRGQLRTLIGVLSGHNSWNFYLHTYLQTSRTPKCHLCPMDSDQLYKWTCYF